MSSFAATAVDARSAYETTALQGVSASAGHLLATWQEVRAHFGEPVSRTSVSQRFMELAATWNEEVAACSSLNEMFLAPSYQRIIALGAPVVPTLLRAMERKPDHWYWALEMLTGANPVPEADLGNVPRMASAWVQWGRNSGLLN